MGSERRAEEMVHAEAVNVHQQAALVDQAKKGRPSRSSRPLALASPFLPLALPSPSPAVPAVAGCLRGAGVPIEGGWMMTWARCWTHVPHAEGRGAGGEARRPWLLLVGALSHCVWESIWAAVGWWWLANA